MKESVRRSRGLLTERIKVMRSKEWRTGAVRYGLNAASGARKGAMHNSGHAHIQPARGVDKMSS